MPIMHGDEKVYGKKYNVEFKWGNGKYGTFSSILTNIDPENFWFEDEHGLIKISQDRVTVMIAVFEK